MPALDIEPPATAESERLELRQLRPGMPTAESGADSNQPKLSRSHPVRSVSAPKSGRPGSQHPTWGSWHSDG